MEQLSLKDTCRIGNISESKVLAALVALDYIVAMPFGTGGSYDFILDDGNNLFRLQVKTGRIRKGCVTFPAWSNNGPRGNKARKLYHGRADVFAVYCPDNERIYVVPIQDVGFAGYLRVDPPLNNMTQGIRWAKAYELTHMESILARVARLCATP